MSCLIKTLTDFENLVSEKGDKLIIQNFVTLFLKKVTNLSYKTFVENSVGKRMMFLFKRVFAVCKTPFILLAHSLNLIVLNFCLINKLVNKSFLINIHLCIFSRYIFSTFFIFSTVIEKMSFFKRNCLKFHILTKIVNLKI